VRIELRHEPAERAKLDEIRAERGMEPVDVIKALLHRPDLFGTPMNEALQEVMRGPSEWSPGERELFAAFVSAQNQCPF
jgi:hypothetical protein